MSKKLFNTDSTTYQKKAPEMLKKLAIAHRPFNKHKIYKRHIIKTQKYKNRTKHLPCPTQVRILSLK